MIRVITFSLPSPDGTMGYGGSLCQRATLCQSASYSSAASTIQHPALLSRRGTHARARDHTQQRLRDTTDQYPPNVKSDKLAYHHHPCTKWLEGGINARMSEDRTLIANGERLVRRDVVSSGLQTTRSVVNSPLAPSRSQRYLTHSG